MTLRARFFATTYDRQMARSLSMSRNRRRYAASAWPSMTSPPPGSDVTRVPYLCSVRARQAGPDGLRAVRSGQHAVGLAAVADTDDQDDELLVGDLVDDPVVADA